MDFLCIHPFREGNENSCVLFIENFFISVFAANAASTKNNRMPQRSRFQQAMQPAKQATHLSIPIVEKIPRR